MIEKQSYREALAQHYARENISHTYNLKSSSNHIKKNQNLVCNSHTAHLTSDVPYIKYLIATCGEKLLYWVI